MKQLPQWLQGLENPIFARLYLAQTINLVGDALTWLGLALLAFELAGEQSGTVLAGALTLRVTAFVVLSATAPAIGDSTTNAVTRNVSAPAKTVPACAPANSNANNTSPNQVNESPTRLIV